MIWTVQESGGQIVVSWGRKRRTFGSDEAALRFVRESRAPGDRVVRIAEDGYRTPVSRRRWRRRGEDL